MTQKESTMKGRIYPSYIYLTKDADGKCVFYDKDPFTEGGARELDIVETLLGTASGEVNRINPLVVQFATVQLERGGVFSPALATEIACGKDMHFEDGCGDAVSVLPFNGDIHTGSYSGVVMDRDGSAKETRTYSEEGKCDDGNQMHDIYAVEGNIRDFFRESGKEETAMTDTPENDWTEGYGGSPE